MRHVSQNETILAGFLPWVETQSGAYNYIDRHRCAVARYLQAIGAKETVLPGFDAISERLSEDAAFAVISYPWTYEALAERLRQQFPETAERVVARLMERV